MKSKITTWLFLLLVWSNSGIEQAWGQMVINRFPYEMEHEGWSLGEGFEWMRDLSISDPECGFTGEYSPTTDSFTLSPTLDLSGLKEPEITFVGKGFIMKDGNGNMLHNEKEENFIRLPLDKKMYIIIEKYTR